MTPAGSARGKKSLGQHWLADGRVLVRIADAAGIEPGDTVVEVGGGTGLLTSRLAERASRLIVVEKDDALALDLARAYGGTDAVTIVHADVLETPSADILRRGGGAPPYVVVGNLPYNIGTAILRAFLRSPTPPRTLVGTLQAEVAERIAAGSGRMTYLGVETQVYAEASVLFRVPPRAFRPPPKVHSAVVRLKVRPSPAVAAEDVDAFLELVHAGFAAPRKRLRNSLAVGLGVKPPEVDVLLVKCGIDGAQRPAMLDLDAWRELFAVYRQAS
ncbi:MAG: ribosomal RNA small subunit methyltransferase A [Chloroflexi bacterium]|nr:ribosomal RNA small subunit methyltransferase A [Chloroflexota bacterium]